MRRALRPTLRHIVVAALIASGTSLMITPSALACHDPWEGEDVCLAVDDCHILVVPEYPDPENPGAIRYDPPYTMLLTRECVGPRLP